MINGKVFSLFLSAAFFAIASPAADLYHIRQLSEREIVQTYTQILRDGCHCSDREWKTSTFDPSAGYWGDGVSDGNEGTRAVVSLVLADGALLKYDHGLSAGERRDFLAKTTAALRYVTATHVTGTQKCTNGKPWGDTGKKGGESWQSGMWTGTLAWGAWLVWDQLDPALQQDLQRVIASEADALAARKPPNGLWLDTKAEENGWEVPCLVLAELMFSTHPRAAAWHAGALKYMMNTLCTEADTRDTNLVDGRPVSQWVGGANLQPDFTLENHNIFHPSYIACSSYFLTQAATYYTYAGRTIPRAATHHLLDTWRMFQTIVLPWGEAAYPQGMDWDLHGLPFINLYATLGSRYHDPFAARMEQDSLQYFRAWQMMDHGSLAFPGSRLGFTRHAINAEQIAYGFLAHQVFGPPVSAMSGAEAAAQEEGVRDYPYVDFIAQRTPEKFASFSWKNKIMGLLMPIGAGHENNPDFTVPIANGFIGSFDLAPRGDLKLTVVEHSREKTPDGFATSGTVLLNGGRLRQTLRMISAGSQTVIYEDHVTALTNVTVRSERGVPVGIENDEITGGLRTVSDQDGQTTFDWQKPLPPLAIPGSWANIDGRLGVVMIAGGSLTYAPAHNYLPGNISVRADMLYGSSSNVGRKFHAGEEVARRVAIFFVEVTPQATQSLAQSCKIETKAGGQVLQFQQPDGKLTEVPLY